MDSRVILVLFLSFPYHIQLIPKPSGLFLLSICCSCVGHLLEEPCPCWSRSTALVQEPVAPQSHFPVAMGNVHGLLKGHGSRKGTPLVCNLLLSSCNQAQLKNPLLLRSLPTCCLCLRHSLLCPPTQNPLHILLQ